jgi:hypothetical protein
MNSASSKIFEFWDKNPDATINDFSDYLKVIWPARGPPTIRSLSTTVHKSKLLKKSGTVNKKSITGKTYAIKTWRLKDD